jgi:hypothetical protein
VSGTGLLDHIATRLQAVRPPASGSWTVTLSLSTGKVTISCTGTWSITWTDTNLRDLLGFTGNLVSISGSTTAPNLMRGVFFPDCVLDLANDHAMAPIDTDVRSTQTPTGKVIAHVGNARYRHTELVYTAVPRARYREASAVAAALTNGSWERFAKDTQLGQGHAWFTPLSAVQIYAHDSVRVGSDGPLSNGWALLGFTGIEGKKISQGWEGAWRLEIAELISDG